MGRKRKDRRTKSTTTKPSGTNLQRTRPPFHNNTRRDNIHLQRRILRRKRRANHKEHNRNILGGVHHRTPKKRNRGIHTRQELPETGSIQQRPRPSKHQKRDLQHKNQ